MFQLFSIDSRPLEYVIHIRAIAMQLLRKPHSSPLLAMQFLLNFFTNMHTSIFYFSSESLSSTDSK